MHRLSSLFVLSLVLLFAADAGAAPSISGLWREVSTPQHKSSYVVFSQQGARVFAACYWEHEGQKVVWHGQGSRNGGRVVYTLRQTKGPRGWDPVGTHTLSLSPDGRTLTGRWSNTRNQSGPLKFIKIK